MHILGNIVKVNIEHKLIGIKAYKRIIYFYFQSSQLSLFKRYLYEGIYIDLEYDENKTFRKKGIDAYIVNYVNQIFSFSLNKRVNYYDKLEINSSLSKFLSSLGNIMFLDLEMTMPGYGYSGKEYKAEIIQAGYLLVDANGDEISRYSNYILPKVNPKLSNRTLSFLKLENSQFYSKAIPYMDFYEDFKAVLLQYRPTVVVYGRNDSITLSSSYLLHKVPSLAPYMRFVNLSKLIKNYYNLKNDAGLFKLYQIYYENDDLQVHDAFNDSYVTKEVFQAFKNDVNRTTNCSAKIRKILEPK